MRMAHAIEMFLDSQADARVRQLWDVLADANLPSLRTRTHRRHRPHVSLTVSESLADADLTALRGTLANRHPTLDLYVLGTFPGDEGVLFLGVVVTGELLTLHQKVHKSLRDQPVQHWPYFLPDHWIPHCTLAQDLDRAGLARAVDLLHGYRPIQARVSAFGITDTATGEVTPLTS